MKICPKLLYAGNDEALYHALKAHLTDEVCRWERLQDPYQVVDRLRTMPPDESLTGDGVSHSQRYRERYAAVILDPEVPPQSTAALLREIKQYDGGVSVIVMATQPSSLSVSLARVDGAEACFIKPVEPIRPLVEAVQAALRKFERWEASLRAALVCSGKMAAQASLAGESITNH